MVVPRRLDERKQFDAVDTCGLENLPIELGFVAQLIEEVYLIAPVRVGVRVLCGEVEVESFVGVVVFQ